MQANKMKLSPISLGLAIGIFWGLSILFFGLLAYYSSYGEVFVTSMGSIYKGYDISIAGSFIGGILGFIDGLITGLIIGWFYNLFLCKCCRRLESEDETKA